MKWIVTMAHAEARSLYFEISEARSREEARTHGPYRVTRERNFANRVVDFITNEIHLSKEISIPAELRALIINIAPSDWKEHLIANSPEYWGRIKAFEPGRV